MEWTARTHEGGPVGEGVWTIYWFNLHVWRNFLILFHKKMWNKNICPWAGILRYSRRCDGPETLLTCSIPDLQLHLLPVYVYCSDLKIYPYSCDVCAWMVCNIQNIHKRATYLLTVGVILSTIFWCIHFTIHNFWTTCVIITKESNQSILSQ